MDPDSLPSSKNAEAAHGTNSVQQKEPWWQLLKQLTWSAVSNKKPGKKNHFQMEKMFRSKLGTPHRNNPLQKFISCI